MLVHLMQRAKTFDWDAGTSGGEVSTSGWDAKYIWLNAGTSDVEANTFDWDAGTSGGEVSTSGWDAKYIWLNAGTSDVEGQYI